MKITNLIKVLFVLCFALVLAACQSNKGGNEVPVEEAQASGMGDQSGFGDEAMKNRLKAPYDQVYYFDFDKYDVHSEDVESINVQANYLTAHPSAKIRIEGNADERGSREYNIALGWKRAKAVGAILKQQGVIDSQIAMVSYGKEKPVAFGHDEDSYRLNRRVNLVYEAK